MRKDVASCLITEAAFFTAEAAGVMGNGTSSGTISAATRAMESLKRGGLWRRVRLCDRLRLRSVSSEVTERTSSLILPEGTANGETHQK